MILPQMITLGGDAELELVDSLDPFSEGVVFSVRPPKKSWKNIANLSGGEKVYFLTLYFMVYLISIMQKESLPSKSYVPLRFGCLMLDFVFRL